MNFRRYAIYHLPGPVPWADWATAWLGWDCIAGRAVAQPEAPFAMDAVTETPRRYGLHATIKAPFTIAEGRTAEELDAALANLCTALAPTRLGPLKLARLGRFLALVPEHQDDAVTALAAEAVRALDRFRAPMSEDERARRAGPGLRGALQDNLDRWGYAHVMEAFRYHVTLTGRLEPAISRAAERYLATHLVPQLPSENHLDRLSLVGEDTDGRFHAINTHRLSGGVS